MRALATILLCMAACTGEASAPAPVRDELPSSKTSWAQAQTVVSLPLLEAPARVLAAPDGSAVVTAPAGARVLRVRVRPGQTVKAGDALVDVLVPDVVHAAGALTSATLRLQAAQARRARLAPLVEQGLARGSELSELDAAIATTRAEAQTARATLRAAGVTDKQARTLLEGDGAIALRAPLTGMVTAVSAEAGEVRDPASGALVELAAPSLVHVEARMIVQPPEGVTFEWLSSGSRVPLVLRAVSPRADAQDGSKLVWFEVAEGHQAPPAGSVGRVRTVPEPTWVTVPSRAVAFADGKAYVVVLSGEQTARVPVEVLLRSGSEAVVVGISPGTRVAADAALSPGTGT